MKPLERAAEKRAASQARIGQSKQPGITERFVSHQATNCHNPNPCITPEQLPRGSPPSPPKYQSCIQLNHTSSEGISPGKSESLKDEPHHEQHLGNSSFDFMGGSSDSYLNTWGKPISALCSSSAIQNSTWNSTKDAWNQRQTISQDLRQLKPLK